MKALEIEHLVKNYGKATAIKNVSFSIEPGEFFGFLGPNGAGKTTTIKCVTGISAFSAGTIRVFGIDVVKEYREARKKIGLAQQEFNVDIFATSRDILYYIGGVYGMRKNIS